MRKLQYKLADGTVVSTYNEAVASGQTYTDFLTDVKEKRKPMSETRKAKLIMHYKLRIA